MIAPKFIPLAFKQVIRHRTRSLLTAAGVAVAMFLFISIEALQSNVRKATISAAGDTTLVVYRDGRFCPFTSRLPEYYHSKIAQVEGVESVIPMKVVVNNCRASLDIITFRGVPRHQFESYASNFQLTSGSLEAWGKRSDATLIGETLAKRRGFKVGDSFETAGVTTTVAGIFRSEETQDQNVAYVHLDFLQQAVDRRLGVVTQFTVKVKDPSKMQEVSESIDEVFRSAEEPTSTRSEKAFVAHIASDLIALVGFTKYLAWGCIAAIVALLGNAIILTVQGRIKEHAVLQTLGYSGNLISRLIVLESMILGMGGAILGAGGAYLVLEYSAISMSTDGLSIPIAASSETVLIGIVIHWPFVFWQV